ncbi:MAG: hypothetical protein ACK40G_08055 [Cytophagaceae bacterium]
MKKYIIYILSIAAFSTSCKKDDAMGPDTEGVLNPPVVTEGLTVSNSNPNFSTGDKVHFNAAFARDAYWRITLIGQSSNARKVIEGVSSKVNIQNSIWDGSATDVPSFRQENVSVLLTFPYFPNDTLKASFSIAGIVNNASKGILVSDFENINPSKFAVPDNTDSIRWQTDWPLTNTTHNTFPKVQGNSYLYFEGTPWAGTPVSPYIDFLTIRPYGATINGASANYGRYFPLYADPNKVFFNIMVYGTGTQARLLIVFTEEGGRQRELNIYTDWTGWRQVSVSYASLLNEGELLSTVKPNRITQLQLVLLSNYNPHEGRPVSIAVDNIIFTHNQPFQP